MRSLRWVVGLVFVGWTLSLEPAFWAPRIHWPLTGLGVLWGVLLCLPEPRPRGR